MYVSSKHHIGKRAGLKNRGYFDIEADYEDFEGLIASDMHAAKMSDRTSDRFSGKIKDERRERGGPRSGVLEYDLG